MSLVLNNNLMAANTARNLNAHYGRLSTSTQRLSSGLRINSAADDAAGLAIRELQRADIAALHQGARNANDAVSMIQVADGALSIIDEKLIRMRELAEQAATGTYDSTQRLMIESEYQSMASEITRIANATDFNGIKLLDGTLKGEHDGSGMTATGQMKIHFGTGNDSAEDYYYVEIGECTSQAFGIGNASTWQDVQERAVKAFKASLTAQIRNDSTLTGEQKTELLGQIEENAKLLEDALNHATDPTTAFLNFNAEDAFQGNPAVLEKYMAAVSDAQKEFNSVGWPTTTREILDKITGAMASVEQPDFTVLYDNELPNYLADLKTAANAIAIQYGIPAASINAIIDTAAQSLTPPYEKDGNLEKGLQQAIETALKNDPDDVIHLPISNSILADIGIAIDNVPLPNQPDDDISSDIPSPDFFQEYKSRVWSAAQNAAKAAGLTDMTALDAVFGSSDPTNFPVDDYGINDWKFKLKEALSKSPQLRQDCADAGVNAITGAIDDVRENYDYKVVSDAKFAAYKAEVITAAKDAASATGMPTANLDAVLAQWQPYPDKPVDQKGLDYYLNDQKSNVKDNNGLMMKDVEDTAKANLNISNKINEYWGTLRVGDQQKFLYSWGQSAITKLAEDLNNLGNYGLGFEKFTLGENLGDQIATQVEAMLSNALKGMKTAVGHMDFAGFTIETQEDAQMALDAINAAIVSKDKIRAHIGAMQNRLENTITNLNVMAENLQAAESRISDVDIATEMTEMVRNQILAQAATAMLAQANSLPQMAMQLIGG